MSTFMGMNLNLTPNSSNNITGAGIWIVLQLRPHFWRRGDGDDALCPKVAEVKFEPHLHFILKIDPPTDFCVWM